MKIALFCNQTKSYFLCRIEDLVNSTITELKLSPKNEGVLGLHIRGPGYEEHLKKPAGLDTRLFNQDEVESILRQAMDKEGLTPLGEIGNYYNKDKRFRE